MLTKIICFINCVASWYYIFLHAQGYMVYEGHLKYLPVLIAGGLSCSMVYLAISLNKTDDF